MPDKDLKLTTSPVPMEWANEQPEFAVGDLLTLQAINDSFARRVVSHAKRRMDLYTARLTNQPPPPIDISTPDKLTAYIMSASNVSNLKGKCFIAAHVFTTLLTDKGAKAKTVRVQGKSDHYFTVVNLGTKDNSMIIDATWQQFNGTGSYCLAGTLKKIKESIRDKAVREKMQAFYEVGLEVLKQWGSYNCFQ